MWSPEIIALVVVTFLVAGFIKGAVGLGIPIVALAFMAAPLGLKTAMAMIVVPCVIANAWQAMAGPHLKSLVVRLWTYLAAASIGTWIGVGVLAGANADYLLALLGVVLILYSVLSLMRPQVPPPGEREPYLSPVAGGLGGVMFGMTGTFIVPGILYLQALGLGRDALVQAMGLTFGTITLALGISFSSRNLLPWDILVLSAGACVPTVIGWLIGARYRSRISEDLFRKLFFSALVVVGLFTIWLALR